MRNFLILIASCLFFTAAAYAHTTSDPNYLQPDITSDWRTLRTAHFNIHHEAAQQAYAQQMGAIAERVHAKLVPWLRWLPEEATEVVILDSVDFSNGAATVLPYNRFSIYLPTPVDGETLEQNPWLEYVFTHEYVHILHLDMAHGGPKTLRDLFGRPIDLLTASTFPQMFAPSWVIEGLATYGESNNPSGYGRLGSAWYEAEMRMEVARGLRSITEISFEGYSGSRWPFGLNYLYGVYFYQFVVERYGRFAAERFVQEYSSNAIPWRMDNRFMRTFKKPPQIVWEEYQQYLRNRFSPQLEKLKQQPGPAVRTLYAQPYFNESLTATGDSGLYFYHDDTASHARVLHMDRQGKTSVATVSSGILHLDWHDRAALLLSKNAVCDNTKLFADLYRWQPGDSKPKRITHCGRYPRAVWHPDGQHIAAVQQQGPNTRLQWLNAQGVVEQTLSELPPGDTLGHLAFSPDGARLVAAVKRQTSGWDLELFDLATRQWQPLTRTPDIEMRPRFSPDGGSVYFLSDRENVWNLRRLSLATGQIETLSNTLTGIQEAIALPDGSFRLSEYTASGYAITALDDARSLGASYPSQQAGLPAVAAFVNRADYQPVAYDKVTAYSPWPSLRPRSWLPVLASAPDSASYFGVLLYGADALDFHQWQAMPLYYYDQNRFGGMAYYTLYNTLTLSAERQLWLTGAASDPFRYLRDELRYQMLLSHSFNSKESSLYVAGGFAHENIDVEFVNAGNVHFKLQDTLGGGIVRYDDTESYSRGISPEDGRRIQLNLESYDIIGSSRHSGAAWQFDWKEYVSLGDSHVLHLRLMRAGGGNGIRPYNLGGEYDLLSALGATTGLGKRTMPLRGYASGGSGLSGTQAMLASAEWRIPLGLVYDGFFVPPIGIGRHALNLFADYGDAWYRNERFQARRSLGAEWNIETLLGYDLLHPTIKLGFAHPLDAGGSDQLYLNLGSQF